MTLRRKTLQRGTPHVPVPLPDVPDVCSCGRRTDIANDMHIDEYPPVDPAVQEAEHRRLGEREGDE